MKNKKGFTLVELLAVIVVLAIVMLVVADRVGDAMLKSRGNSLALQVKSLNREVEKVGAMDNQINTNQINKIVSSGDLTYLGYVKAGTKIGDKVLENDAILVQAVKGSKFSNISFTKDIENLGTLVSNYNNGNITKGDSNLKNNKDWLRQPIIYFETTTPIVEIKTYNVGEIVSIGKEKFNVIKDNEDSVTMLAKNVLTKDGLAQTTSTDVNTYAVAFANMRPNVEAPFNRYGYWTDDNSNLLSDYGTNYPVNVYNNNSKLYSIVETYVSKLKEIKSISSEDKILLTGRLVYLSELVELGYSFDLGDCKNDKNSKWLTNGQNWWSGTAYGWDVIDTFNSNGSHWRSGFWLTNGGGARPVITIDKSLLD